MSYYCGIDFGTSNSVVTVLDDAAGPPRVFREPSLMFFAEDDESTVRRFCGTDALEQRIRSGARGRFFQSVKSILPDPGFTQTRINGKPFTVEDLVAVMLRFLRERAEDLCGVPVRRAVIGRPARFSDDPAREALAGERLARAALQAGIEKADFVLEPVAGAFAYRLRAAAAPHSLDRSTVFVADHGGGTSDFTVMELAVGNDGIPVAKEILATHGIRAGGDDFDGAIMWNRLVGRFGHESHFESFGKMLPVPVHIYHIISHWDQIHFLKTLSYRAELRTYLRSSDNPTAIRRLIKLVEEDLGYFVFQAIERAKIGLSAQESSSVDFEKGKLRIHEAITREEFERYIADHTRRIADAVDATLAQAGDATLVNTVFLTGGSGRVPAVRAILADRFGEDRIIDDTDHFQSVSLGLALAARDRKLGN